MITATKKILEFTRILMFHRDSSEFIMILMVTATKKVLEFTRILLFNRDSSEFIVKSRLRYICIFTHYLKIWIPIYTCLSLPSNYFCRKPNFKNALHVLIYGLFSFFCRLTDEYPWWFKHESNKKDKSKLKKLFIQRYRTDVLQIFSTICQVRHDALNSPN